MKQDFIMDWMILVGQDDFIFGYLNNFYLKDGSKKMELKLQLIKMQQSHILAITLLVPYISKLKLIYNFIYILK